MKAITVLKAAQPYLKPALILGSVLVAMTASFLLGSYRSVLVGERNLKGYQLAMNTMYLGILAEEGRDSLQRRILSQTDAVIEDRDQPERVTPVSLLNAAVLGKSLLSEQLFMAAAWTLKDARDRASGGLAFPKNTSAFVDSYNQKYPR